MKKKFNPHLILASASPRRKQLMRLLGLQFAVAATRINETPHRRESTQAYVTRMAREKAQAIACNRTFLRPTFIVAADTVVSLPRAPSSCSIFGKPKTSREARYFLKKLSGKTHRVMTALTLIRVGPKRTQDGDRFRIFQKSVTSRVRFRRLTEAEITAYIRTGDWRDKAGGYGIQARGAFLVESASGSFSNIVGLPVEPLLSLLKTAGFKA